MSKLFYNWFINLWYLKLKVAFSWLAITEMSFIDTVLFSAGRGVLEHPLVSRSQTLTREERVWWLAIHGVVPPLPTDRHQSDCSFSALPWSRVGAIIANCHSTSRAYWDDRQARAPRNINLTWRHVKRTVIAFQRDNSVYSKSPDPLLPRKGLATRD